MRTERGKFKMASYQENDEQKPISSPNKHCPVQLTSKTPLFTMLKLIHNHLSANNSRIDENNDFIETVKAALFDNVQKAGQTDLQDSSKVPESCEGTLEEVVEKECNDCLVSTTALRVNGPKQVRTHLKTLIRHELKFLMMATVEGNSEQQVMEVEGTSGTPVDMTDVEQKLHDVTERLNSLKEDIMDMDENVRNLNQAAKIFSHTKKSVFTQAIYDTPPNSPIQTDGQTVMNMLDSVKISKTLLT